MKTLSTELHMTMMVVTHEMGFAREVADRMAFFHEGRILEQGPPSELIGSPRHAETRAFLDAVPAEPATGGARGRTRRRVEVRREEILLAAIGEVERVGLAAVRVSDVAAALGISSGLVFYHFGTKDELVAEAFTYAVERDLAAMDRAAARRGSVLDRLRAVLRIYGPTGSATGWRLWIDGWSLAQHEPVIATHFRQLEAHSRRTLRGLVDEGLADGSIAAPTPTRACRGSWRSSTVSRWPPRSWGR